MAADAAPAMAASGAAIGDDVPLQLSPDLRLEELPCLGPQFVEIRTALRHPRLEGPVAYVGGQELAPLLRDVRTGMTSRHLAQLWSGKVPPGIALSIVRWLSGQGVLERCAPTAHQARDAAQVVSP